MTFTALLTEGSLRKRMLNLLAPLTGTALVLVYFAVQAKFGDYIYFTNYFHSHFFESTHTVKDARLQFGMVAEYLKLALPFSVFAVLAVPAVWLA